MKKRSGLGWVGGVSILHRNATRTLGDEFIKSDHISAGL